MEFYKNQLFHIYNQGNNGEQLFYSDEHYELFKWKMKASLLPFGRLISYCLMPNHFHWQFYVDQVSITKNQYYAHYDKIQYQHRILKYGNNAQAIKIREDFKEDIITLNEAVGQIQRSYTRAINKKYNRSGSLFRIHCKAKDGWIEEFITVDGQFKDKFQLGNDYANKCMEYIHNNPVSAGLVKDEINWIYSSARNYAGLADDNLVDFELGRVIKNDI